MSTLLLTNPAFFQDSSSLIVARVLEVVSEVLPNVVSSKEEQSGGGAALALTALRNLHTKEKKTERVDHLMVCHFVSTGIVCLSLTFSHSC